MKFFQSIPCLLIFVGFTTADSMADAQATPVIVEEPVIISPPPALAPGAPVVIKERRKLFHRRTRVYVVKPRSRRISVPATIIEPAESQATVIEAPALVGGRPEIIAEPPVILDEPRSKVPDLDRPEPEGEVSYQVPKVLSTPRSATVNRSTPR